MVLGVNHSQVLIQAVVKQPVSRCVAIHGGLNSRVIPLLVKFALLRPAPLSLFLKSHDEVQALVNQLRGKLDHSLA